MTFFCVPPAQRLETQTGRKLLRLRTSLSVTTPRLHLFAFISARTLVNAEGIPYIHALGGVGAGCEVLHLLLFSEL